MDRARTKAPVQEALLAYSQSWAKGKILYKNFERSEEEETTAQFLSFTSEQDDPFGRHSMPGHFTGSALVTNASYNKVLLTLHGKLNIWLQLGGHAEGEHLIHEVARKETSEESGLTKFGFLDYRSLSQVDLPDQPLPFDLDRHLIPARKGEPEHYHYDVRYLIQADCDEATIISDESHDLRWFSLSEARQVTNERSMHRQFDKLERIATLLSRH